MNNTQNTEQFFKAIVKAALSSLFAIGIKSPEYVDRFATAFQNALEKNLALLPQPQTPPEPLIKPVPEAPQSPTKPDDIKADIKTIIENTMIQKALRNAKINTIEELITKGQQEDYATIKGIKRKSADEITEKLKKWNQKPQS